MGSSLILPLGVAAALVGAWLCTMQLRRRSVQKDPGRFRCALRIVSGDAEGLAGEFGQSSAYAQWARDVLLVWSGAWLGRVRPLEVVTAGHRLYDANPREARGLGSHPLVLSVGLESGATIEVAAARRDRERLMQPFVGPRAVRRRRGGPEMLEETARLVRRARKQHEQRKEQELPR